MRTTPKILLIEDDASIASGLKKELRSEGYEVLVATRGDDGLAQAKERLCDVVLNDRKMPGLSGLQLIEQLHATKPKLFIIMMTAFGTTETAIEATKLGAFDYVLLVSMGRSGENQVRIWFCPGHTEFLQVASGWPQVASQSSLPEATPEQAKRVSLCRAACGRASASLA